MRVQLDKASLSSADNVMVSDFVLEDVIKPIKFMIAGH
jgi:hypothetical protein